MGHMLAREYGRKARDAARQVRVVDRDVKLIVCGSSSTFMPTYLVWDREVLEECYDQCVLMLNRDLVSERELTLDWRDPAPSRVLACETLTGSDLKASNTFAQPKRVVPHPLDAPRAGSTMTFKLPARSYSVANLATS